MKYRIREFKGTTYTVLKVNRDYIVCYSSDSQDVMWELFEDRGRIYPEAQANPTNYGALLESLADCQAIVGKRAIEALRKTNASSWQELKTFTF